MAGPAFYNVFTPIGEAPDERAHFQYLRFVADEGRLPGAADSFWQGHQPPLYLLWGAGGMGQTSRIRRTSTGWTCPDGARLEPEDTLTALRALRD
jgi:hypothetical protein